MTETKNICLQENFKNSVEMKKEKNTWISMIISIPQIS